MPARAPSSAGHAATTPPQLQATPVPHPGRWVTVAAVGLLAAMLGRSVLTNPRYQWDVVGDYLTARTVMAGLATTLELTAIAMVLGAVLGVGLAVMGRSPNPIVAGASHAYIWFFRGTPVLVQVLFWNFLGALYPRLSLGVPFGPELVSADTNTLITTFTAAILGLGLNEAAYMAEIVRAGITSVEHGQTDAALALGMTRLQALRCIILPQALRVIIPPTGNELIAMLKTSSVVSVIATTELLYAVQLIYSRTYQTIPLLIVASIWYLAVTTVLTVAQRILERRLARGSPGQPPPSSWRRLRPALAFRYFQEPQTP